MLIIINQHHITERLILARYITFIYNNCCSASYFFIFHQEAVTGTTSCLIILMVDITPDG